MMKLTYLISLSALLILQTACLEITPKSSAGTAEQPQGLRVGVSKVETCFAPKEPCDKKIIGFINQSQKTLDIAIYAITHPDIVESIIEAHKKGVQVRMVVDRTQAAGNSSLVDTLIQAGIPLKIGNTGRAIMHNKFTIVDGAALETGSYNYTKNASFENAENQIYLTDADSIERFQNDFELLWSNGLTPRPEANTSTSSDDPQASFDF